MPQPASGSTRERAKVSRQHFITNIVYGGETSIVLEFGFSDSLLGTPKLNGRLLGRKPSCALSSGRSKNVPPCCLIRRRRFVNDSGHGTEGLFAPAMRPPAPDNTSARRRPGVTMMVDGFCCELPGLADGVFQSIVAVDPKARFHDPLRNWSRPDSAASGSVYQYLSSASSPHRARAPVNSRPPNVASEVGGEATAALPATRSAAIQGFEPINPSLALCSFITGACEATHGGNRACVLA